MALSDWEKRPADEEYFAERTDYVRLGDLFTGVPLAYPWPPDAVGHSAGSRKFLSGPFEPGFGMLMTPTCSLKAQREDGYAHPIRSLAPVLPLAGLIKEGVVKEASVDDLRVFDHLISYLYVPALPEFDLPESLALLYAPMSMHHDYLEERRVAQLSEPAAIHLKYKLTALYGGILFSHDDFEDGGAQPSSSTSKT